MQKYQRRKGSKRWTSVPILKQWVLDACPPLKKIYNNNNKDSPCLSGKNFNRELFPKKYKLATNTTKTPIHHIHMHTLV